MIPHYRTLAAVAIAVLLATPAAADFVFYGDAQSGLQTAPPATIGGPVGGPAIATASVSAGGFLDVGQAFSQAVAPFVNAALQAVLAAGLAWLGYILKQKFDINITQGQRDTVQTWLTNQAGSLIADGAVKVEGGKVTVDKDKLDVHVGQFATQIPDAVKFFKLSPETLAAKIVDKIPQTAAGAQLIAKSA